MSLSRRHLLAAAPLLLAPPAQAQGHPTVELGPLRLEAPWTRAALAGRQGAGFLTIRNTGAAPDRLVDASSPVSERVELHTHIRDGDVMRMRPVPHIEVPAGGEAMLRPGGLHLMFMGLRAPLVQGTRIPVTLRFAEAGEVTLELEVREAGARGMPPRH